MIAMPWAGPPLNGLGKKPLFVVEIVVVGGEGERVLLLVEARLLCKVEEGSCLHVTPLVSTNFH